MKITTHIFQTLLIGLLFTPAILLVYPLYFPGNPPIDLIFFGLLLGVIYPDTDCPESSIFKIRRMGPAPRDRAANDAWTIKFLIVASYTMVFLSIGYLLRCLIYFPSYWIISLTNKHLIKEFKVVDEHRGIAHTLLGLIVATGLFFILSYITMHLFDIVISNELLLVFTISFFIGGIIHLLQDSISMSGVKWLYPFKGKNVYGEYSVFQENPSVGSVNFWCVGVNLLNFVVIYYAFKDFLSKDSILGLVFIATFPFMAAVAITYSAFKKYNVRVKEHY